MILSSNSFLSDFHPVYSALSIRSLSSLDIYVDSQVEWLFKEVTHFLCFLQSLLGPASELSKSQILVLTHGASSDSGSFVNIISTAKTFSNKVCPGNCGTVARQMFFGNFQARCFYLFKSTFEFSLLNFLSNTQKRKKKTLFFSPFRNTNYKSL